MAPTQTTPMFGSYIGGSVQTPCARAQRVPDCLEGRKATLVGVRFQTGHPYRCVHAPRRAVAAHGYRSRLAGRDPPHVLTRVSAEHGLVAGHASPESPVARSPQHCIEATSLAVVSGGKKPDRGTGHSPNGLVSRAGECTIARHADPFAFLRDVPDHTAGSPLHLAPGDDQPAIECSDRRHDLIARSACRLR